MLACLAISACLLATAAALNTSTAASSSAATAATSSSSASSSCLGYECRRRRAFDAVAVFQGKGADGVRDGDTAAKQTTREPKKLAATTKLVRATDLNLLHRHHKAVEDAADDASEDGDDPVYDKQVLHESAARMAEDLRKEEDEEEGEDDDAVLPAEQGHVEEGRAKRTRAKIGKKVDSSVLHMILMLKTMPLMFVSTKVAVLGFLVQLKSLVLSLVSVGLAAVEFFWRLQEKRQRTGATPTLHAAPAPGWEEPPAWPDRRKYI